MKYIASWSGGKESTASIILAHENNEPLDLIIFSEVMFDENISGELPEHIDFIKNKCIPLFESWGYEAKILHSDKTYMDCFNQVVKKPRRHMCNKGRKKGFPMPGHCNVNRDCKSKQIKDFYKSISEDVTQYIGIAIDEPERLSRIRISDVPKISLLEKYGYTERMAFGLCKKYDLLSPIYDFAPRGAVGSVQTQGIVNCGICGTTIGICGISCWNWKKYQTSASVFTKNTWWTSGRRRSVSTQAQQEGPGGL